MHQEKLIILLKSIKKEEISWLAKFVRSPFYNQNEHVTKLFELLRKYHPTFEENRLSKEFLFQKIFLKTAYDANRIRVLMHRLLKLIEQFFVANQIRQEQKPYSSLLVRQYGRRNLYAQFVKKSEKLLEELDELAFLNTEELDTQRILNQQIYAHPATNRQQYSAHYLTNAMESLDAYFVLSKMKLACAIQGRLNTVAEEHEVRFIENILQEGTDCFEGKHPIFELYRRLYLLQQATEGHEQYYITRDYFTLIISELEVADRKYALQFLLNYAVRAFNRGEKVFMNEGLNMYQLGLENQCLLEFGEMTENTFCNIANFGILCEEYDWTKEFIQNYQHLLNPIFKNDAVYSSLAFLQYQKKNYAECISILYSHSFKKPLQIFHTKALHLRALFELFLIDDNYFELLISFINTFEKYAQKHKIIPETKRKGYLNFLKITRSLALKILKKESREVILNKIEQTKPLMLKNWLYQKIGLSS